LNRLEKPEVLPAGTSLLIPNIPGLFIPFYPENDLELMLLTRAQKIETEKKSIKLLGSEPRNEYFFIPGRRFSKLELAFFLGILFRFPLPKGVISSQYGPRNSPLTGERHFHGGIDIAAPMGTDVYAARDGKVIETGYHQVLGTYCILQHEGGYQTIYAHLKSLLIELNQTVPSGMIIASLGNSGMSTGPHLHFEIRKNGAPVDPKTLLPKVKQ
jgi:murein DD-endopeptidase MepM/ murein hydrolase activator NlpD